ncbi:MAG TPA: amidohydrolase family protein [Vicinamibacterales bacterium]|nr:amidohydrolase family protein [Vicinamibacterales bacterium]
MKRRSISLLTLAVAAVLWLPSAVTVDGQAQRARVIALRGGTVYTVTKGTIQNGTVLIRDGKIAAVGANVSVPSDAEVIDTTGRHVSPGIIDAHSHIANDSINEGGTTVSSMTGMEDVLDPTDISIYRDLAGGLTTANILHGSANPIGGKNAVIKLRWGVKKGDDLLFEGAMPGIKFALGENPKDLRMGQITGPRRYPLTRAGVEFVIRDAFTRAKAYQKAWKDHEKAKSTNPDATPPRRDLQLEPLVEILEGKRLVHAHSYRADEILMLIRLADEMGFKIATFQHVLEGYKVAKEIAAHGAGASTFSDWWGYKIEADDAIPHNAAIMVRKGVLVSINSDSAEHARRLNTEAAKSMRWGGLNEDEALALVTINPAKQLRIDSRVGSLEVGKDADIAVWTHHPLSSYAIADRVYIDGRQYYDRKGEETRLTELRKEKAALAAAERGSRGTTTPSESRPDPSSTRETPADRRSGGGPNAGTDTNGAHDGSNSLTAPVPAAQASSGPVLAIVNAHIFPVTSAPIEKGTIVIRGSRIEAVGANVQAPQGATIIDAKGGHVYPGFINARTSVGIGENGVRGYDDISEMHDWNQHLRTRVSYHSESETIPVARGTGVTTVGVAPSGGIMSGEFAVMNLDGWTWEEATVRPNAGIIFNFPALGGGGGRGGRGGRGGGGEAAERTYDDIRRERDRRLDDVIRVLDQARAYAKAGANRTTDWSLEALVPVVERKLPLIVSVTREQDIKDAVAFADRAKINIVISGAIESNYAAQLLKEKNVPVILGNVLAMPSREDNFHASTYQLAGELAQAGVRFAFSSGDNTNVRLVPFQAAMSVAWGLDREAAIRALTIGAAEILGVANRIGSLEPGKDANLFIANGDPLEVRSRVTHVVIQGRDVGIDNKHEALYRKYIARP